MAGLQTGGFNLSVMPQFQPLDPRLFQGLTAERATESFRRGLGLADELQDRPQVRALQDLLRQLQQAEGESKLGLIPAVTEQTRAKIADSMKELETAPARRAQEAAAREQAAANAQLQQQTLAARLKAQQEEEALGLRQDEEGFRLAQQLTNLLPVLDRGIGTDEMSDEFLAIAENAPLRNALSGIAPFITGGLMRGRELAEPARDMAKGKGSTAPASAPRLEPLQDANGEILAYAIMDDKGIKSTIQVDRKDPLTPTYVRGIAEAFSKAGYVLDDSMTLKENYEEAGKALKKKQEDDAKAKAGGSLANIYRSLGLEPPGEEEGAGTVEPPPVVTPPPSATGTPTRRRVNVLELLPTQ